MVKSEAKRLAPQHLGAARDKWADGMEWPKLRGVEACVGFGHMPAVNPDGGEPVMFAGLETRSTYVFTFS